MVELGTNNQLLFHAYGYEAWLPEDVPMAGMVTCVSQAEVGREAYGYSLAPHAGASWSEVGLYGGLVSVLTAEQVIVPTALGAFRLDAGRFRPLEPPSPEAAADILRRFGRIASGALERATRPATMADKLLAGHMAIGFLLQYNSALYEEHEKIRRSGYR